MQQPPEQASRALRLRRTRSDLSSVPARPIYISATQRQSWPQLPVSKRPSVLRKSALWLMVYGVLLGGCFLLMYPLLFRIQTTAAAGLSLTTAFPWLTSLFWTRSSWLVATIGQISWLNVETNPAQGGINLWLLLLLFSLALFFLAARECRRALNGQSGQRQIRFLVFLLGAFTLLFGLLFVFLPGSISQGTLLAALDGQLIAIYHMNPYLISPAVVAHDALYRTLDPGVLAVPQTGPLGLDLTVPLAWLIQDRPAFALLDFRLAALFLHLLNALLIWQILAKLKPEARLAGTLLYAWNPAVLLLGVSEVHADIAVIFFLLLSIFLLQRKVLLVSWVCLLLAALINPLCLLLGPLLLHALLKETRDLAAGRRILWWIGLWCVSFLVVVLAYAPYWSGLGIAGIVSLASQTFWQHTAQHSLLAALEQLPFAGWPPAAWLLEPHHWLILLALTVGILFLLGIWIADNAELLLLFGSWIFLALALLLPVSSPWLILLPLALALASSSHRTSLLAHLLALGSLLAYALLLQTSTWSGQALVTIGLPALIWGWTLFFLSTWEMTHPEETETGVVARTPRRSGISLSRPSWPSRPAAWPSRPGARQR